jgi:dipeptidyl aminopeptidase/acylaminoacyl peptidase
VYASGARSPSHLIQESSEWGVPYWLAGYTSLIPLPNDRILAAHGPPHLHCLTIIDVAAATFADIPSDYTSIAHSFSVNVNRSRAFAIAAGAHTPYSLIELDLQQAAVTHVIDSIIPPCKPEFLPVPRPICITGSAGRNVHAILHPATHPEFSSNGPTPLIVTAHGGPTSAATAALRLKFAYAFTTFPSCLPL